MSESGEDTEQFDFDPGNLGHWMYRLGMVNPGIVGAVCGVIALAGLFAANFTLWSFLALSYVISFFLIAFNLYYKVKWKL